MGRDFISDQVQAIDEGVYPRKNRIDPRDRLVGYDPEAFQPPLYYLLAAPLFAVPNDYLAKVRVLRAFGLLLLALAILLCWQLAQRIFGAAALPAFSLALTVFMWPGVVVRAATVSNAALEIALGVAIALALWRAQSERSHRHLLVAGLLTGLGLLTRPALVWAVPLLVAVAVGSPSGQRQALAPSSRDRRGSTGAS